MKKILFLLLMITSVSYGQAIAPTRVKITNNAISTSAPFIAAQETDGFINKINKSDLIDVVEITSAVNLPITGVSGKIYVTLDNNRLYRWTGTIYQDLANTITPTNLDLLAKPDGIDVFSSTGNYITLPLAIDGNSGLMSPADKTKLTGLSNYTHPTNHPPSIITQDASNRFVTDAEKTAWNAKQSAIGYTTENIANKNIANGYAGLGSDGKLISSQLPSITISDTYVVASQVAMLGLTGAEKGDVAVRTDLNKSFILKGNSYSTLADWQELLTPTSAVTTVFGRNGAVTAQTGDYTATMVGAPSGSGTSTGTNTGDQTTINGNAGTATVLQTARTINGVAFNGSTNITVADATKEPSFSKNTAFNKNFGTTVGTVAEGNDSRILNGQTAFGWGNHAGLYPSLTGAGANGTWGINISGNASSATHTNLWDRYIDGDGTSVNQTWLMGYDTFDSKWKPISSGVTKAWLGLGSNAYTSTAYLPLTGGNVNGNLNVTGNIGIGTASPQQPFVVSNSGQQGIEIYIESTTAMGIQSYNRSTTSYSLMKYDASSHLFNSNVTAPAFFQSSDSRLKNILKRDGDVAYFKWKDGRDDKTHIGYIAQEVRKENPDQVQKGEDKMLSVNYVEILVEKVRLLEKRIEELEKK